MKFRFLFVLSMLMLFAAAPLLRAMELPADPQPMDMLNYLRDAAIKNDVAQAVQVVNGRLKEQMLRDMKIPKPLREKLLNLSSAFEDTFIRHTGNTALVYALINENGKTVCHQIKFTREGDGYLKITEIAQGGTIPGARVYLDRFLAGCNEGNLGLFHIYLSDDLKARFTQIPVSLRHRTDTRISSIKNTNTEAIFSVTRLGLTGRIKLKKAGDSHFWTITEISPELTEPTPKDIYPELVAILQISTAQVDALRERMRAETDAATAAKKEARLKFFADAKTRAENDPALKDEIGKPSAHIRNFLENTVLPHMKDTKLESLDIYENLISATEAEVDIIAKYTSNGSRKIEHLRVKMKKNGDTWDKDGELVNCTQDWIVEFDEQKFRLLRQEIFEVASTQVKDFFVENFFSGFTVNPAAQIRTVLTLLATNAEWLSQNGDSDRLTIDSGIDSNDKNPLKVVFVKVGNSWKIESLPLMETEIADHPAVEVVVNFYRAFFVTGGIAPIRALLTESCFEANNNKFSDDPRNVDELLFAAVVTSKTENEVEVTISTYPARQAEFTLILDNGEWKISTIKGY